MKIGILGTGNMGSGLGRLWAAKDHAVYFGSRTPSKAESAAGAIGGQTQGGSFADAAAFGDVLVLPIPWTAAEDLLKSLGSLEGKTIIDLMNAFGSDWMPAFGEAGSLAEKVAEWAPGAHVVKAFNGIHFRHLGNSQFQGMAESLFLCGDNADAKAQVIQLGKDAGLDPVDCGDLVVARLIEPLAFLWMQIAFGAGYGSDVAFKLLRR
jgi:predicted dinucleotide-binding enzyme